MTEIVLEATLVPHRAWHRRCGRARLVEGNEFQYTDAALLAVLGVESETELVDSCTPWVDATNHCGGVPFRLAYALVRGVWFAVGGSCALRTTGRGVCTAARGELPLWLMALCCSPLRFLLSLLN